MLGDSCVNGRGGTKGYVSGYASNLTAGLWVRLPPPNTNKVGTMEKYLELFAKALDLVNNGKPIGRSPYELETNKEPLATGGGREMESTPKEPSTEQEA